MLSLVMSLGGETFPFLPVAVPCARHFDDFVCRGIGLSRTGRAGGDPGNEEHGLGPGIALTQRDRRLAADRTGGGSRREAEEKKCERRDAKT